MFRRRVSAFLDSRPSVSSQQELLHVVTVVFVVVIRVMVMCLYYSDGSGTVAMVRGDGGGSICSILWRPTVSRGQSGP